MKKIKYYYSEAVHVRTLEVVTDAEGNPIYIPNIKPIKIKNLPRVTVASVLNTKTNTLTFGSAVCAPNDVFKKSTGRDIALKRALEFPEYTVRITNKSKTRSISQRYANQLITQHLNKYVRTGI